MRNAAELALGEFQGADITVLVKDDNGTPEDFTDDEWNEALQRLEELTGKAIFIHEGRRLFLTAEGETVLSYARSIVGFHDEMLSQLASPDIEGYVVLGTPEFRILHVSPGGSLTLNDTTVSNANINH